MRQLLLIITLSLFVLTCKAQYRNIFPFNAGFFDINKYNDSSKQQYYILFDSTIQRKPYPVFNMDLNSNCINSGTYTDNNELIQLPSTYLYSGKNIYFNNNNFAQFDSFIILRSNTKIRIKRPNPGSCGVGGGNKSVLIPCDSNHIYLFVYDAYHKQKSEDCVNSGYFKYNIKTESSSFTLLQKDYLDVFYQPHSRDAGKLWIIARDSFSYDVYLKDKDSLILKWNYPHAEYGETAIADFNSTSGWLSLSINNFKRAGWFGSHSIILKSQLPFLDSSLMYSFYRLDGETGQVSLMQVQYRTIPSVKSVYIDSYKDIVYFAILPVDCEFSPNDSVLYVLYAYSVRNAVGYCGVNQGTPTDILQVQWQKGFIEHKIRVDDEEAPVYTGIELAADGRIYISKSINFCDSVDCKYDRSKQSTLSVIQEPNRFGAGCRYLNNALPLIKAASYPIDAYNLPEHFGRFTNLRFYKKQDCDKLAQFELEDSSQWQFCDWFIAGDSIRDNYNISYKFKDPGIYKVYVKGTHKSGYVQWFSDTIRIRHKPLAYFDKQSSAGCQYVSFAFKDGNSVFEKKTGSSVNHVWDFGDGNGASWKSSNIKDRKDMQHVYNKDGSYTVTYIVNDGYCSDTMLRINEVKILPAPRPGIDLNPVTGCTPLKVTLSAKYAETVDSTHWYSSDSHVETNSGQTGASFIFFKPGVFQLYQCQFGATGCITRDTAELKVLHGLESNAKPELISASVEEVNKIELNWKRVVYAQSYLIYRDHKLTGSVNDTFFTDETALTNDFSYTYNIYAIDSCENKSLLSNPATTILLKADNGNLNTAGLKWNHYRYWAGGTDHYNCLHLMGSQPEILRLTTDSMYTDSNFMISTKTEKCYQVIAFEKGGNVASSKSNIVCVPYKSFIWIPTALTVNGDGLNESLKINAYGISSFKIEIFNRWGQKVYQSSDLSEMWLPNNDQQGVYIFVVKASSEYGEYDARGTITVLR